MTDTSGIPDKTELERQQLYLANEKIRIETKKLEAESEPEKWWSKLARSVVAFGGIATVAATMYGLYDSYSKTITDRAHTRTAEQRVQFEDAVKRLEASGTVSKLVGVSVLSSYLNHENENFHHQILFTLASLVATEQDLQTQTAVANLVSATPTESISKKDWFNFQDTLASQSRALVIKGDLYRHRQFGLDDVAPSNEERAARFVAKLIALNIRNGAVPEYTNYAGIYCEDCDFRGAVFPMGTDFTASVLDGANFRGARLELASFDNTDLGGTAFVEANLRSALFRTLSDASLKNRPGSEEADRRATTPYLMHVGALLTSRARITITMPDFSCANLDGASFDHYALIPVAPMAERSFAKTDESKPGWYKTVPDFFKDRATAKSPAKFEVALVRPPKFYKANLHNAQLGKARYFAFDNKDDFPDSFAGGYGAYVGEFSVTITSSLADKILAIADNKRDTKKPEPAASRDGLTADQRGRFQDMLQILFYQANTEQAVLPDGVAEFLKKAPAIQANHGIECSPATTSSN